MSRRLDIEITSISGTTATWRAAGAKQPKGVLNIDLLSSGASVGQVFRAEIDQFMEGVEVLSVAPPRQASPVDPRNERLTVVAPESNGPDVQVTYAPKGRGRREESRGGDDRRNGRERPRRSDRPRSADTRTDSRSPKDETSGDAPDRPSRSASPRATRERSGSASRPGGRERPGTPERPGSRERSPSSPGSRRPGRADRGPRPSGPAQPPVTTVHRNGFLATLSSEQLPVAEQLLRGGMPAVRKAVEDQNRNAIAQSRPTINADVINRIAEELMGRAALANWKDRAAGAQSAGKELRLRDLRAVVTSAKTVTHDDESREQLKVLRESLTVRVTALRDEWLAKLQRALDSGDVLEALRLTIRTPEPTTRVSSESATSIAAMASAALTKETPPPLWREIVNTTADSPIRRLVKPTGIPEDPECHALALKNAGSIPEFAKLLGMKVPPPPPPTRATTRRPVTRRSS